MPKVPQLEQQVAPQPLPGARVGPAPSPQSYGAGAGETTRRIGAALYEQEVIAADRAAVMEAETLAGQEQLRIMQGVTQLRGKQAAEAPLYAAKEFDAVNAEIMKGLNGDRQKGMYESVVQHKRDALDRFALSHFNQEHERFQEDTFKANISQSVDVARANAESPVQVAFEKDFQEQKIRERAARLGYDGTPQEQNEINSVRSRTNAEVIKGLLDKGQDLRAQAYYEHLKKGETGGSLQFTAQDRDAVEQSLMEGSTRGESRRQAKNILQEHGIDTPEQRRNALDAADNIADPKVSDLTRQRLEHLFAVEDKRKSEEYEQTFLNSSKMVQETARIAPDVPVRDLVPVALWQSLKPDAQHSLELQAKRLRDPEDVIHDIRAFEQFHDLSDAQVAKLTLSQLQTRYLDKFDQSHHDYVLKYWNAARNAVEKGDKDPKFLSVLSDKERIKNSWIDTAPVDQSKPLHKVEHGDVWFNRYEEEARRALENLPSTATPKQKDEVVQGVADKWLKQKFKVNPGIFSREKDVPAIGIDEYLDARGFRIPLEEIPEDRRNFLKGVIGAARVPATDDRIERLEAVSRLYRLGKITTQRRDELQRNILTN